MFVLKTSVEVVNEAAKPPEYYLYPWTSDVFVQVILNEIVTGPSRSTEPTPNYSLC
jgi:hypothetical protein